jgi:hypothetical protein
VKVTQEMLEGGSPCRGCHSYSTVCSGHHTQLGPILVEFVLGRLQGRAGSGDKISLFVATRPDRFGQMEGAQVFILFCEIQSFSCSAIPITGEHFRPQEKKCEYRHVHRI